MVDGPGVPGGSGLTAAMRTILSVIGPHSGCGKSTFVTHVLRHVGGLGCLKVSPARDWPEVPAGSERITGDDFYLEDAARLNRPGKDTALYLATGAVRVERLRYRGDAPSTSAPDNGWQGPEVKGTLAMGLDAALRRFPEAAPVIVESSSAVRLLSPAAVVLIVRPPLREMKPATEAILSRVTDLLINASDRVGPAAEAAERLRDELPALRPPYTWSADLIAEPPPAQMLTRLRTLLTR